MSFYLLLSFLSLFICEVNEESLTRCSLIINTYSQNLPLSKQVKSDGTYYNGLKINQELIKEKFSINNLDS